MNKGLSLKAILWGIPMLFAGQVLAQGGATCGTATVIAPGSHVSTLLAGGGATPTCSLGFGIGETQAAQVALNARWYSYTPTANGTARVTALSALPTNDTRVSVFRGTCGSLTCWIGDDDISGTNFLSDVMFPVLAGETYFIQWDDFWAADAVTFSLTFTPYNAASAVTVNTFPYTQEFTGANTASTCGTVVTEPAGAGLGWINHTGDGADWLRRTGTTPSTGSGTGPNNGYTGLAGDSYLYLETSQGTCSPAGYYAVMTSPVFDKSTMTGTGDAQVSWYDHMFGATTGRMIVQFESPANTGNWTTISTKTGNQGNQWNFNNFITLSGATGTFRVRFIGWRDAGTNSFSGDMAIDHVVVRERPDCTSPVATASVTDLCGTNAASSTFTVTVNVSSLGSLSGIPSTQCTIVPSSGASQVANAPGNYVFGPYTFGQVITFNLTHQSEPGCNSFIPGSFRSCCSSQCSSAFTAAIGVNANANTAMTTCTGGATNAYNSGAPVPTAARWWTFTPATSGVYTISACDQAPVTNADTRVTVHTGGCGGLTLYNADDDGCTTPTFGSLLNLAMFAGTTYYIEWDNAWNSNAHTWTLSGPAPFLAGDECGTAIPLTQSATCTPTLASTAGMTQQTPSCAAGVGATTNADMWFSFVATSDLVDINITPVGTYYPILELLDGSTGCTNPTSLCCTFSGGGGGTPIDLLRGGLTVGATYYLRVGHAFAGGDGGANQFNICVTDGVSPTPGCTFTSPDYTESEPCGVLTNSDLCTAEPIVLGSLPFTFTIGGTIQAECNFRDRDFFVFTLPSVATYQIDWNAQFASRIFFLDANGNCADPLVQISTAGSAPCVPGTFTQSLAAGTYALMMTTDGIFNNITCGTVNDYEITITAVPNLDCSLATPITCGGNNSVALSGNGLWSNLSCGFTTPGNEALYLLDATVAGVYNLTVVNSNGNFIDYMIKSTADGCTPSGWTCLQDIAAPGTSVNFNIATPGQYWILADAEDETLLSTQDFRLFCPPGATSTDFCAPEPISCGTLVNGQTTPIPGVFPANACPYSLAPSTAGVNYWSLNTGVDQEVTLSTCGSAGFDTRISVYAPAPDCNNLECVALNDDGTGCPNFSSQVTFAANGSTTYVIAVHGFGGGFGFYQMSVFCGAPCTPAAGNDLCSLAQPLTPALDDGSGVPTTGDNTCAYGDLNTSCDPFGEMKGVWYSFNSGVNSIMLMDLVQGSASTLNYALYDGGCNGLGALGELDCVLDGADSDILLPALTPGQDYLLEVWNGGGLQAGDFTVLLRRPGLNDAAIDSIVGLNEESCGTLVNPVVALRNAGEFNLTSVDIVYAINGGTPQVFPWTGNLAYQESINVALPAILAVPGTPTLSASTANPNGVADDNPLNDATSKVLNITGEPVTVVINTDNNGGEVEWQIVDNFFLPVASGGPYPGQDNLEISTTACLSTANGSCYYFFLTDAGGDGICCLNGAGYWELRTQNNRLLLRDNGAFTTNSPSTSPQSPSYFAHEFCLPGGPTNILSSECGIFTNTLQNKVYTSAVAGVLNYQFEFSDPDAGFKRRIAVPRPWVKFLEMQTSPLQPGTVYFCRARVDQGASGFADDTFGTGCEMGLDANNVPGCTQLIDDTNLPTHSCNATKTFGGSDKIWAVPVVGATQYRFRFENPGEGYLRNIVRPSYVCVLNWVTNPMPNGIYSVSVEVFVNGVWGGFCGASCPLTIFTPPAQQGRAVEADHAENTVSLFPNPVSDGRVQLRIDGLTDAEQAISVELYDLSGQRVLANQYQNGGSVFNTVLELDGSVAKGMYLVNITVNGRVTTQRLSVM